MLQRELVALDRVRDDRRLLGIVAHRRTSSVTGRSALAARSPRSWAGSARQPRRDLGRFLRQ